MTAPRIYWVGSPKFTAGHPAPLTHIVLHRMVGTLRGTDATFANLDGRQASTTFGAGIDCRVTGHVSTAHVHQYVRLGDQAWGNGNWDATGLWNDRYPTTLINSRTISVEHHDNGNRALGAGKGIVPEDVLLVSIELDRLLLRGDLSELRDAGIRFRAGTEQAIARELRAIPVDRHHIIDHNYISGRKKPYCWKPWSDDRIGFPQARYLAALIAPAPEGDTVNSYPVPKVPSVAMVPSGTWLYSTSALQPGAANIQVNPGREMPYLGAPTSTYRIVEYVDDAGVHSGVTMFAKVPDLGAIREVPGTNCAPAIDAALAPVKATLAEVKADLVSANAALAMAPGRELERIAMAVGAAEADRIRGI